MNDMTKPIPQLADLPSHQMLGGGDLIVDAALRHNQTMEHGLEVMADLIATMRSHIDKEAQDQGMESRFDVDIESPVVDAFCNKLDFVIATLESDRESHRGYLLRNRSK